MSDCLIKSPTTFDNSFVPALRYTGTKPRVKFSGTCLKQNKITFTQGKIVNIYIAYHMIFKTRWYDDYSVLENSLFGPVKLVKKCWYW